MSFMYIQPLDKKTLHLDAGFLRNFVWYHLICSADAERFSESSVSVKFAVSFQQLVILLQIFGDNLLSPR